MNTLSIGTANFAQNYGLTQNVNGLDELELSKIFEKLNAEKEIGIDTSPSYGESEKVLGSFLKKSNFRGKITTKIPIGFYGSANSIAKSLELSLKNLGLESVHCTLLHGFDEKLLENHRQIIKGLEIILSNGFTKTIGLSCYTEREVLLSKKVIPQLSVFQVPENVIDQRLRNSETLKKLSIEGNSFYVRSIFLQGKILAQSETFHAKLSGLRQVVKSVENSARTHGLSKLEYCVSYAKSLTWSSGIVVGIDSTNQLVEILEANTRNYPNMMFEKQDFDQDLIDPRTW